MVHWEWTFYPLGVYFLLFNYMKILSRLKLKVHYKMDFNYKIFESLGPLGVYFKSTEWPALVCAVKGTLRPSRGRPLTACLLPLVRWLRRRNKL